MADPAPPAGIGSEPASAAAQNAARRAVIDRLLAAPTIEKDDHAGFDALVAELTANAGLLLNRGFLEKYLLDENRQDRVDRWDAVSTVVEGLEENPELVEQALAGYHFYKSENLVPGTEARKNIVNHMAEDIAYEALSVQSGNAQYLLWNGDLATFEQFVFGVSPGLPDAADGKAFLFDADLGMAGPLAVQYLQACHSLYGLEEDAARERLQELINRDDFSLTAYVPMTDGEEGDIERIRGKINTQIEEHLNPRPRPRPIDRRFEDDPPRRRGGGSKRKRKLAIGMGVTVLAAVGAFFFLRSSKPNAAANPEEGPSPRTTLMNPGAAATAAPDDQSSDNNAASDGNSASPEDGNGASNAAAASADASPTPAATPTSTPAPNETAAKGAAAAVPTPTGTPAATETPTPSAPPAARQAGMQPASALALPLSGGAKVAISTPTSGAERYGNFSTDTETPEQWMRASAWFKGHAAMYWQQENPGNNNTWEYLQTIHPDYKKAATAFAAYVQRDDIFRDSNGNVYDPSNPNNVFHPAQAAKTEAAIRNILRTYNISPERLTRDMAANPDHLDPAIHHRGPNVITPSTDDGSGSSASVATDDTDGQAAPSANSATTGAVSPEVSQIQSYLSSYFQQLKGKGLDPSAWGVKSVSMGIDGLHVEMPSGETIVFSNGAVEVYGGNNPNSLEDDTLAVMKEVVDAMRNPQVSGNKNCVAQVNALLPLKAAASPGPSPTAASFPLPSPTPVPSPTPTG